MNRSHNETRFSACKEVDWYKNHRNSLDVYDNGIGVIGVGKKSSSLRPVAKGFLNFCAIPRESED